MANGVPKLEDVAKLAGVSKSTASRILAVSSGDNIPFAIETQEKVRSAADMLGYRPSKLARGLTKTKTGIVGLVIPSVKDSFFPSVTSVIETKLAESGYSVILCNTSADSVVEREKIEDLLAWRVDGLIVAPSQESGDAGLFWDLWRRKVPFVLIDRSFSQTPFYSVTSDDFVGATMAVEHLLSIGRTRIACAGGSHNVSTTRLRYAGYTETLIRNGILPDPSLFINVVATEEGGAMAVRKIMQMNPRPDALFCLGDPVAIGAMDECIKQGIRIPEDLALVGYADLDYSRLLRVPLTTVHQPRKLLGRTAAELLVTQMDGGIPEIAQPKLPVELMVRESTVLGTGAMRSSLENGE